MKLYKEIIIVGAGPAGLQLGYYFNELKKDYIILEQTEYSGSFFNKYPHSKELLSINKKNTGTDNKEFNLRHDWNSLLNNFELQMTDFSNDYYPTRNELFKYLNEFSKKHNIKIKYNTIVKSINKDQDLYKLNCFIKEKELTVICKQVIVATGLSKTNIPYNFQNIKLHSQHYGDFPKNYFLNKNNLDKYKNKKCLIIGGGNSAYELANMLNNYCSHISVYTNGTSLSFTTHYSGNVRSKYTPFFDTFYLKSLNAIYNYGNKNFYIENSSNNQKHLYYICNSQCSVKHSIFQHDFDYIINCTGWNFDNSIIDKSLSQKYIHNKYPIINSKYESINNENLFFIGALMHVFDFKISSGGFIHGFRYLIDNFVKINYTIFEPKKFNNINELIEQFIDRINTSSGLYQMFGQLADIFYLDTNNNIIYYYEQVPLTYYFSIYNTKIDIPDNTNIFIITLNYGKDSVTDISKLNIKNSSVGYENKATFLHPIIHVFKNVYKTQDMFLLDYDNLDNRTDCIDIIHFDENLFAEFTDKKMYTEKFIRLIKSFI